jgi:hypothetical protein
MLNHTNLLVEFLIAGVLILYAVLLLVFSVLPVSAMLEVIQWFAANMANLDKLFAFSLIPTIALAYAFGMLTEIATRSLFDRWLLAVRRRHVTQFFSANRDLLAPDLLFQPYAATDPQTALIKDKDILGQMRFVVLMKSERLYTEIEYQINQMRVLRVLLVFLAVIGLALAILLARQLMSAFTPLAICGVILTAGLFALDLVAIRSRYTRYFRAIEFSYKALLSDKTV